MLFRSEYTEAYVEDIVSSSHIFIYGDNDTVKTEMFNLIGHYLCTKHGMSNMHVPTVAKNTLGIIGSSILCTLDGFDRDVYVSIRARKRKEPQLVLYCETSLYPCDIDSVYKSLEQLGDIRYNFKSPICIMNIQKHDGSYLKVL